MNEDRSDLESASPPAAEQRPAASLDLAKKPFAKPVLLAAAGLALVVACISPEPATFLLLGGALLVLSVLLALQHLGSKLRLLSFRVRPQIVLLVTTVFLCLVFSELALRLFFFQGFEQVERASGNGDNLGYHHDPDLGWAPIPGSRKSFDAGRRISIEHNSKGLRDSEPVMDDRPGMMFLGDSFVWGYNSEVSERFTEKLRARHPQWRIYNCGVTGYSTDQEYLWLQKHFDEYHPRVVFLVYCSENDDSGNCTNAVGGLYYKPYYLVDSNGLALKGAPVPRSDRVFCVEHPLLSRSYLVRLIVRAYAHLRSPTPHLQSSPTAAILQAMRDFVSAHGAVLCVGTTKTDPEIERATLRLGIACLDLGTDLRVKDDAHWSPEGHDFVAAKIEEFLAAKKLP